MAVVWLGGAQIACYADVGTGTIRVKVLVDDEERRRDEVWKQVLVARLDTASQILSQYGDTRFAVTAMGRWDSQDGQDDFNQCLKDLEKRISPDPADLVIGFSSQFPFQRGQTSLGGTRGPLNTHVLIREGARGIMESERLEVLVHELGHYLGAAHSNRPSTAMRPILGDGISRYRDFQIRFDPLNAEVIHLVTHEMKESGVARLHELSIETLTKMRELYVKVDKEFPEDPVAKRYVSLMDRAVQVSLANRQAKVKQMERLQQQIRQMRADRAAAKLRDRSSSTTSPPTPKGSGKVPGKPSK